MEPEDEQQQTVPMTPAETTAEVVEDTPPGSAAPGPHLEGVAITLVVATLASLFLRRLGRSNAAGGLRRWLPVLYTSVWAVAIIIVTLIYARGLPSTWFLAIWLLFLVVAFASVGWLRSVMAGVALSVEGRIRMGDSIRVRDVSGEVISFGMRSVRIRSVDGAIHEIPNEKLVTQPVANLTGNGGDSACELTIAIPDTIDPDEAAQLARRAAVLTPLASPRHRPDVFIEARGQEEQRYELRIRGYAFDATYHDHFRSDVVSRLQAAFASMTRSREVVGEPADRLLLPEQ